MRTLHFLTDVYGPRVTGTPNLKASGDWALRQMTEWGLSNAHLEPWDFGRPGWINERLAAHIVAPVKDALVVEALAWTPGTNGVVRAQAYHLVPPENPTREALTSYLEGIKQRVTGRAVLTGRHHELPVSFRAAAKRRDEDDLRRRYDGVNPQPAAGDNASRGGPSQPANALTPAQVSAQIDGFLGEAAPWCEWPTLPASTGNRGAAASRL